MTMSDSDAKTPLSIQATSHNPKSSASDGDGVKTIDVDGTPVKLDKLGPMIINSDGVSGLSCS